jgi:hypothetical protein
MRPVDRAFGWLLVLAGIGHGLGSYGAYSTQASVMLWALSASFAIFLLAAVNLLRVGRPGDRSLAWVSFGGCLIWIAFVIWFGLIIRNPLDFRALINFIITAVLAVFSLRSAVTRSDRL